MPDVLEDLLDLNQDHALTIGPRSSFCTVGMHDVMAIGHSGHHYIVQPEWAPESSFPKVYADYDDEEGTGDIIAEGAHWPVFYLFHNAQHSYGLAELQGHGGALVDWAQREHQVDLAPVIERLLAGKLPLHEAYARYALGSILTRHLTAVAEDAPRETFLALLSAAPWYGAPLAHLRKKRWLDAQTWPLFLYRNLRWDLGNSTLVDAIPEAAPVLLADPAFADDPLVPMLRRATADPDGYWKGAEGYFEAGQDWEARGDPARAWACYHNAIWIERSESEEFHEEAWERLSEL